MEEGRHRHFRFGGKGTDWVRTTNSNFFLPLATGRQNWQQVASPSGRQAGSRLPLRAQQQQCRVVAIMGLLLE